MTYTRYDADKMLDLLVAKYPQIFFAPSEQRLPLSHHILQELAKDTTLKDWALVEHAVNWYRSHLGYQFAVVNRKPRINLAGKVVAQITDAEVAEASAAIQEVRRKQKQKHDLSRAAPEQPVQIRPLPSPGVPEQVQIRPLQKASPMPTIPEDLAPLFDVIERRLSRARAIAVNCGDDPDSDLLKDLLATVLRAVAAAASTAAREVSPDPEAHLRSVS